MALREGGLLVTLDMGGDPLKVTVNPENVVFNDNQWHTVTVHRTVKEVRQLQTEEWKARQTDTEGKGVGGIF